MNASLNLLPRMFLRDWRAGELAVVAFALVLATTALTSVAFLADRIERALRFEANQLLGGDLLLSADHPWPQAAVDESARRGLRLARSTSFISMVIGRGESHLADIKAVSPAYPLRGRLRIAPAPNRPDSETTGIPPPGTAWLDERLAGALGLRPGDRFRVGERDLFYGAVLTMEPDRGFNAFALAPRLMINEADLVSTGLLQEGSRVSYRLHLAGAGAAVEGFRAWMEPRLGRGERLETLDNARPEIRNVLERAQRFLRLAALMSVVLSAVAVALASDRYVRRHLDACAVMRCLGATSGGLLLIHGGEFLLLGLFATVAGGGLGYVAQIGLQFLLASVLRQDLPAAGVMPWVQGAAISLTLVIGFSLPPLLRLRNVPTVRVLRREWGRVEPTAWIAWSGGATLLALLLLWIAGEMRLGLIVLGGFAAALLFYAAATRVLLALLGRYRGRGTGSGWRYGLAALRRRRGATLVQSVALALALTALLLLTVARGDLLSAWQARIPAEAPNRFVINIQPEQRQAVAEFFRRQGLPAPPLEPMVRGRLVAVNGRAINPDEYADEQARRLVDREFNLSWSAKLPEDNRVTAGRWHGNGPDQFSVEQGLAEKLGLKPGDELTYDVAGSRLAGRITSLRQLEWDSMRVNFFVIAAPGMLENFPASYVSSFYLPRERQEVGDALVKAFPNLTVIDVAAIVRQVQDTVDDVIRAVQAIFIFALIAGIVVLYASLQSGADARAQEIALMRALGAREAQLVAALAAELSVLGAMAGGLSGGGAALVSFALARWVFHLSYVPSLLMPVVGAAIGIALCLPAGWLGSRPALRRNVMEVLRTTG